jgi:hypothetical protein
MYNQGLKGVDLKMLRPTQIAKGRRASLDPHRIMRLC